MKVYYGIQTQYKGPTDSKGTRIIASYLGKEKYIHFWDYGIDTTDNHYQAAQGLRLKLNWLSDIESGCITKTGYAWAVNRL